MKLISPRGDDADDAGGRDTTKALPKSDISKSNGSHIDVHISNENTRQKIIESAIVCADRIFRGHIFGNEMAITIISANMLTVLALIYAAL